MAQLTQQEFKRLFDLIVKKTFGGKKKYPDKNLRGEFFGCDKGEPFPKDERELPYDGKSIKSEMLKDIRVVKCLKKYYEDKDDEGFNRCDESNNYYNKFPGYASHQSELSGDQFRYIAENFNLNNLYKNYNSHLDVSRTGEYLGLKLPRVGIAPRFLDAYECYTDIKVKDLIEKKEDKFHNEIKADLYQHFSVTSKQKEENPPAIYIGYYYNFDTHDVKSFELRVYFNITPKYPVHKQEYYVEEAGIHDNDGETYKGYAYELSQNLHVVLYNEKNNEIKEKLKIIMACGGNPKVVRKTRGIVLTQKSLKTRTVAVEIVFVNALQKTDTLELSIKRYIFIHRYNFRVEGLFGSEIKAGGRKVNNFESMKGFWLVLRYTKKWKLKTSLLHVREDYRTLCYTINKEYEIQKQFCAFDIPETNPNVLCFKTTQINEAKVISYFMIECPREDDEMTIGTINLIDVNPRGLPFPMMRGLALFKEDDKKWNERLDKNGEIDVKFLEEKLDIYENIEDLEKAYNENPNQGKIIALYKKLDWINTTNGVLPPTNQ
jgi:hypothetical protein